jgi:hypothetical protein
MGPAVSMLSMASSRIACYSDSNRPTGGRPGWAGRPEGNLGSLPQPREQANKTGKAAAICIGQVGSSNEQPLKRKPVSGQAVRKQAAGDPAADGQMAGGPVTSS